MISRAFIFVFIFTSPCSLNFGIISAEINSKSRDIIIFPTPPPNLNTLPFCLGSCGENSYYELPHRHFTVL